jgi:uncharacterized protein
MAGKVVIITGASSGFGKLAAVEAARRAYRVAISARRAEKLDEVVREIEGFGGQALAVAGDITDADTQQRLIDETLARWGRIDALVNNAGVPLDTFFADASLEDLQRQWATNTTSVIELTKRALPSLIESQGVVINISSSISRFSVPSMGLYAPSKVAASSISDALRRELRPLGVHVCTVEPGPYKTEFAQRAGANGEQQAALDPREVALAIVRLIEHPRRMTVLPFWLRPLIAIGGGIMALLPDLIDRIWWFAMRRAQAEKRDRGARGSQSAP